MGAQHENAVRAFIGEIEGDRWNAAQVERILSRLAPDARYHVYAWERPVTGHEAIRAELLRQARLFGDLRIEIKAIASTDHTVLIERVDRMTVGRNRKPLALHVAAVLEVDEAGKISAWREYYDSKEINVQLGADVSTAGTRA
jgi:limonene-1,2-epoxide hydrolase